MPDAAEAIGQDMDQEAADELGRGQPHDLLPVAGFDAVILPAEGDGPGIGPDPTEPLASPARIGCRQRVCG